MYHIKNVSSFNVALHAERGTKMLGVCDRFHGNSSLRKRPGYETNFDDQTNEIEVETTILDSALADMEGIDVLKMDIEGSECDALLGASRLLMGKKIKTLIAEWNPDSLGADASKSIHILRENFNEVGYPKKDGEITPIEIDELPRYSFISNLVCTKKL